MGPSSWAGERGAWAISVASASIRAKTWALTAREEPLPQTIPSMIGPSASSATGARAKIPPRAEGIQLPDGQHSGGDPPSQTPAPGPLDRGRREHATRYDYLLAGSKYCTPVEASYARHVYHVYAIRSANRDRLQSTLHRHGVQTGVHYPIPVHLQRAYADLQYGPGSFPHAEAAAREVLSLPMFPELTEVQQDDVAAALQCMAETAIP